MAIAQTAERPRTRTSGGLLGFSTFFRKEVWEWRRGKALWVLGGLTLIGMALALALPFALRALAGMAPENENAQALNLVTPDSLRNILLGFAGGGFFAPFLIFLACANLLVGERLSGTLSWNMTKPLARQSYLLAKWCAATLLLWLTLVLVPVTIGFVVGAPLYGLPPNLPILGMALGLAFVWIGFYVLLMLALGVFISSQGAIIGIGTGLLVAPLLFATGAIPAQFVWAERIWPTNLGWTAQLLAQTPPDMLNVASTVTWFIVLAVFTVVVFNRQELN